MKVLRFVIALLFLVCTVGCGTAVEDSTNQNTTLASTSDADSVIAQYATQICTRISTCIGEMTCSQPVEMDMEQCVTRLMGQNVDSQAADFYENLACGEINKSQCGNNLQLQELCECPTSPQGNCNPGLYCSVALSTQNGETFYACGTEIGGIPVDAPSCDQTNPCAEGTDCIVTSTDGASGSCMTMCEQ